MKNYKLLPKLIVRTPLLPLNFVLRNTAVTHDDIRALVDNPIIKEALYISSPDLYKEFEKRKDKQDDKLFQSVLKYLHRMSTRCTPFGLSAGICVGEWSAHSNVLLKPFDEGERHTRLDMSFLCLLSIKLATHPAIRTLLKFYPNNTLYKVGKSLRYIEWQYSGFKRRFHITKVDTNDYLEAIFELSRLGATIQELETCLHDLNISEGDATDFVSELVSSQVLVSELEPVITGQNYEDHLLSLLDTIYSRSQNKQVFEYLVILKEIKSLIKHLDSTPGHDIELYERLYAEVRKLGISFHNREILQTDFRKRNISSTLDSKIAGSIRKGIQALDVIAPKNQNKINEFARLFQERFETEEIPLLLAMDNESGIGYGPSINSGVMDPSTDDVPFSIRSREQTFSTRVESLIQKKISKAIQEKSYECILSDDDLKPLEGKLNPADTFSALFSIVKTEDLGSAYQIKFFGSSSSVNLLGRFTPLDSEIHQFAKSITDFEAEQHSDKIIAEIVHLPIDRLGNVSIRSHIREYEIPIGCKSTLPPENQIHLEDLYVSVNEEGKILLRSKSRNKIVIPRLGTAHNYASNSLPVYYFLCDLQFQENDIGLLPDFSHYNPESSFLPRIRYGNIIINRAQWRFEYDTINELTQSTQAAVISWRNKHSIPRLVVVTEFDNELLIDFDNPLSVKTFIEKAKKEKGIKFSEYLLPSDILKDTHGEIYCNEIHMAFQRTDLKQPVFVSPRNRQQSLLKPQRNFIAGSEWIYYKIYAGAKTIQTLLSDHISELVDDFQRRKLIDEWFFVQYKDPQNHLRLRFKLTNEQYLGEVMRRMHDMLQPHMDEYTINKVQIDSYKREIERYGADRIEIVEKIFHAQSMQFMEFLNLSDGRAEDPEYRLLFGIFAINKNLEYSNLSSEKLANFVKTIRDNFARELEADNHTNKSLTLKFRRYKDQIQALVKKEYTDLNLFKNLENLFDPNFKSLYRQLDINEDELLNFLGSIIHMNINKIAISNPRKMEFVCYDLLLQSLKAKREKANNSVN